MELNERDCWGKAGPIRHDNTLSFKGLDIRSRPLTYLRLAQRCSHANSSTSTPHHTLQWVGKREKRGPEHGLDFREMAMKEKLILCTIVLLLVSWFALDAVAAIILPLRL